MNNKKFTDKESAKAFLKETEKPFKLKIVCAIVAVAVLVLMILADSVWHPALTADTVLAVRYCNSNSVRRIGVPEWPGRTSGSCYYRNSASIHES